MADMTPERYKELQYTDAELTEEEKAEGWFFCCEWDGMLMKPNWKEAECCGCLKNKEDPDKSKFSEDELAMFGVDLDPMSTRGRREE